MASRLLLRRLQQNPAFKGQADLVRFSVAAHQRRLIQPSDASLANLTRSPQIRSYRTTLARFTEETDKEAAPAAPAAATEDDGSEEFSIPKYADRPDDCPEWQNPQHHNNPEMLKMNAEDFAEGEEMPINPLPPLDGKAPPHIQELADDILHLNMLEMHELVKMVQEHFGWSDAELDGPAMMMGGGGGGQAAAEEAAPVVERTTFDLKLEAFDAKSKIKVIKEVRAIAGLGLKEAKELVEGAPKVIKKEIKKEEAEELKAKLEEIGATISIV
jgi:large subunit ribosomal protein L7/L12